MTPKILAIVAVLLLSSFMIPSPVAAEDCFSKFGVSKKSVSRKLQEKQELILIDVRNSRDFERFRIPGSVNIPLFAIKTKSFLKGKSLVLISERYNHKELEQECEVLTKSGFTVSILNGGLFRWRQEGGPLEGDGFAQGELNKISPQTFFAEQASGKWVLIDISQREKLKAYPKNVQRMHIPYTNNPERFIPELRAAVRNFAGRDCSLILICDEDGKKYEAIERKVQQAGLTNVLYLKGGFQEYRLFEQQQSSRGPGENGAGKSKSAKASKSCKSCP